MKVLIMAKKSKLIITKYLEQRCLNHQDSSGLPFSMASRMNVPSGKIHSGYQGCHGCVLQEVFILADHFPSVPVSTVFILSCTTELVSAHRRQGGSSQSLIDRTCWSGRRV